jgi:amidase
VSAWEARVPVVGHLPDGPGADGYVFGTLPPVATLQPGSVLRTRTEDCFGGVVRTPRDLPSRVCDLSRLNPLTGPYDIAGAEPGSTLAVHILSLTPARDWAVSATFPHFGALTSTTATATLQPALEERVWVYEIDTKAWTARYQATRSAHAVDLRLDPMLGTLGVAPPGGQARASIDNGAHGGNLDTPWLRAGTTLYLPVNVPGALLAFGDGHARQGDGEACGVRIETAMDVALVVDVIPADRHPAPAWPRIETDTHLACVGAARPLEDAFRIAHTQLVGWVGELTGLDVLDAYQLVSQTGIAPIGNVCDHDYTVVAALPKAVLQALDAPPAWTGSHARLRAIAGAGPSTSDPHPAS